MSFARIPTDKPSLRIHASVVGFDRVERLRQERDEVVQDYLDAGLGRLALSASRYKAMGRRIERLNRIICEVEARAARGS